MIKMTIQEMHADIEKMLREQLDDPTNNEEFRQLLNDILEGGCESGVVTSLIYYEDTEKFFLDHCEPINELLADCLENCGTPSAEEMFGKRWDTSDPLALHTNNRNLLAWFAVEEVARELS